MLNVTINSILMSVVMLIIVAPCKHMDRVLTTISMLKIDGLGSTHKTLLRYFAGASKTSRKRMFGESGTCPRVLALSHFLRLAEVGRLREYSSAY
jgi:hypothetical protein